MAVIATRPAAAAIVAHLNTADGITAHLSVGTSPPATRTVIVHPVAGSYDGPLGNPDAQLVLRFQTTSIGATAEQALWTHDQVVATLLRAVVTIGDPDDPDAVSFPIWPIPGSQQPVQRDDDLATTLYYATSGWVAHVQPA